MSHDDTTPDLPLPLVAASLDEASSAIVKDPSTPIGAAALWWEALEDPESNRAILEFLSATPTRWGDYSEAGTLINDLGMASNPQYAPGRSDIAYVKFIASTADVAKSFGRARLTQFIAMTLVKRGDIWVVWGLHDSRFPSEAEISND